MILEIRKLETEWINLKEKFQETEVSSDAKLPIPSVSALSKKRCQIKLNGYGQYFNQNYNLFYPLKVQVHRRGTLSLFNKSIVKIYFLVNTRIST